MEELLHVTTEAAWAEAQAAGGIEPGPDGFIHLCTAAQLAFVLRRHFAGRSGLVALHVEGAGLPVRWEESEPGMPPFPHLYGRLPQGAVRRIEPLG